MILGTQVYENVQINKQVQLIHKANQPLDVICIFIWNPYNFKYQAFLKQNTKWLAVCHCRKKKELYLLNDKEQKYIRNIL